MKRLMPFLLLVPLLCAPAALAQFIDIRVSYKVILNRATGARPVGATDTLIDQTVARMNQFLASYSRGHRLIVVEPVAEVGGLNDTNGPSKWFWTDFSTDSGQMKDQMESAAKNDVTAYRWNQNAINIYINAGHPGGICSFPDEGDNVIIIGIISLGSAVVQLHEIGHYFRLCHTQGCYCAGCSGNGACTSPGDDEISDTLSDLPCWDTNQIAMANFNGRTYAQLNAGEQSRVQDVFFNIMSYHGNRSRLTEKQLDRWSDIANGPRRGLTTGRTWFVDHGNSCFFTDGSSECTLFGGPHTTVAGALNDANVQGGDVILIRPGSYNQRLTITKPVTLRATRQGSVTIGR